MSDIARRKRTDSFPGWHSLTRDVMAGAVSNGTASVSVVTTGSGKESKTPSTMVSSVV